MTPLNKLLCFETISHKETPEVVYYLHSIPDSEYTIVRSSPEDKDAVILDNEETKRFILNLIEHEDMYE